MSQDCDCENIIQNSQLLKTINPTQGNQFSFCDDEVDNWSSAFNSPHHLNIDSNGDCNFDGDGFVMNCMRARRTADGFSKRSEGVYYFNTDILDIDGDNDTDEFQIIFKNSPFIPNYCVSFSTQGLSCVPSPLLGLDEYMISFFASSDIDDCITINHLAQNPYATGTFSEEIGSSLVFGFDESTVDFQFEPMQDYEHIVIYPNVPTVNGHITTSVTNVSVTCNHTALNTIEPTLVDCKSKTYSMEAIIDGNHPIAEYFWSFGDGFTSTEETPVHSYDVNAEYQVCLITKDIYGCCGEEKCIPLSVPCGDLDLVDLTYVSGDRLVRFGIDGIAPIDIASIEWDFGDGNTSTELNPLHLFKTYDNYNVCVSITDGNGCCTTICETITLSPPLTTCGCIVPQGTLFLDGNNPDTDQLSDFTTSGLLFDGDMLEGIDIYVDGIFEMDANFTFDCDFFFKKGAGLDISSPGKVEIINSELVGCTHMWRGIAVNGTQPQNTFWFRGNTIKDAYAAIEIKDGSNILQNSNVFTDNYIGVYSKQSSNLKHHFGSPILNSRFDTKGNMLIAYNGQPDWSAVPFAGIYVNDLDHLIVRDLSIQFINFTLKNRFVGIKNGIIAYRTNLIANGNIFNKLVGIDPVYEESGRCISGQSLMSVEIKKNRFYDSGGAVQITNTRNTNINIIDNLVKKIDNTLDFEYGVNLSGCHSSSIAINDNEIYLGNNSSLNAISIKYSNNLSNLNISDNNIFHEFENQNSLELDNISMDNGVYGHVNDNVINKNMDIGCSPSISLHRAC